KQNYFHCPSCGHKTNADRNGSINIAARLLTLTKSLHSVRGLGKWASSVLRSKTKQTTESPTENLEEIVKREVLTLRRRTSIGFWGVRGRSPCSIESS
ncbi:MAG: zinc ribbon domain-containing protein, partial [Candidatus Thorarchaeota archaeon]|nr:zinc ribbon domain-containing protein [Candidatus Thorarchaeota archaeon]